MTFHKKFRISLLLIGILLFLSACSNSIYNELGVSADEPPSFKEADRREGSNKTFVMVELVSEGSGEEDAKKLIADAFTKLKEEYRVAAVELVDEEEQDWYGVYMEDDTVINYITALPVEELTSGEKALLSYYEGLEEPAFPVVHFSQDPIFESSDDK